MPVLFRDWLRRSAVLVALGVAGVAIASAQPPRSAAREKALIMHEWQPPLAWAHVASPDQAITRLRRILAWQQASVSKITLDPAARDSVHTLWAALRGFDLHKVYETLPDAPSPPWRALNLRFRIANGHYRAALGTTSSINDRLSTLGAARFHLAMRPKSDAGNGGSRRDRYELVTRWRNDIGPVSWGYLEHASGLALDRLVKAAPEAAPLERQGTAVARNPRLDRSDQPTLAQIWTGFPATTDWFSRWGQVDNLTGRKPAAADAQHLDLVISLDPKRLESRYPAVAAYIAQIDDVIDWHIVFQSARGRLLTIDIDSGEQRLTLSGWVAGKQLVPGRAGRPAAGDGRHTLLPANGRFDTITDTSVHSFGIRVVIHHQRMRWQYRHDAHGVRLSGRLRDQPRVSVTGRAFGIVPVGVLEVLSPVSVQDVINDFMSTLVASNNGRGGLVRLHIGDHGAGDNLLAIKSDLDILDNFLVRFGVRLATNRLLPDSDALAGLRRMAADGLDALTRDLDRRAAIAKSPRPAS